MKIIAALAGARARHRLPAICGELALTHLTPPDVIINAVLAGCLRVLAVPSRGIDIRVVPAPKPDPCRLVLVLLRAGTKHA